MNQQSTTKEIKLMYIPHSPAPWYRHVSIHDSDVWEIRAQFCDAPIGEVPRWRDDDGTDSREALANLTLMTAAPRMYETLRFVAEMLGGFKPDFLRQMGLDAALEETLAILTAVEVVREESRP